MSILELAQSVQRIPSRYWVIVVGDELLLTFNVELLTGACIATMHSLENSQRVTEEHATSLRTLDLVMASIMANESDSRRILEQLCL